MFKDKLKEYRLKNKLTQQTLADNIYVSRSTIASWENGLSFPSNDNILRLCECLNVSKEDLLDETIIKNDHKHFYLSSLIGLIIPLFLIMLSFIKIINKHSIFEVLNSKVNNNSSLIEFFNFKIISLLIIYFVVIIIHIVYLIKQKKETIFINIILNTVCFLTFIISLLLVI